MMPSWYKTALKQPDIVAGTHFKLQKDFETIFMAMKAPTDMAMFGGRDFVAPEQPYYFAIPSGSEVFTKTFLLNNAAQPCSRPQRSECSLLVGHADAWDLLNE